ncbi:Lrp/AsnC ligand binding domain-containing protein [Nitrosopumilus sp.]|uniref:Lrp/AsnC ligand binding domain-containing protein n=1 Tax=Nitrosopumilus sp. TaxID=2024843 RepID=UPI00292CBFC8|nr:Lrp/AsnC ligand binding domain-containing protein [Nitrosopumilus sp.]
METAFVLLSCDLGSESDVIQELKHIESVKETDETFGAYDIVAKIENSKKEKLKEIINWNIRKIDHVRSTLTLVSTQ